MFRFDGLKITLVMMVCNNLNYNLWYSSYNHLIAKVIYFCKEVLLRLKRRHLEGKGHGLQRGRCSAVQRNVPDYRR